ncbi:MAG TPA: hypothetical protein PLM72_00720 [Spirochaetota bacterium]|nr:hypothetical protein [Spirochaetota bacterium]
MYDWKRAPLRGASRDRTIAHFFEMSAIVLSLIWYSASPNGLGLFLDINNLPVWDVTNIFKIIQM